MCVGAHGVTDTGTGDRGAWCGQGSTTPQRNRAPPAPPPIALRKRTSRRAVETNSAAVTACDTRATRVRTATELSSTQWPDRRCGSRRVSSARTSRTRSGNRGSRLRACQGATQTTCGTRARPGWGGRVCVAVTTAGTCALRQCGCAGGPRAACTGLGSCFPRECTRLVQSSFM
jgi:hypothetical protein